MSSEYESLFPDKWTNVLDYFPSMIFYEEKVLNLCQIPRKESIKKSLFAFTV